MFIFSAVDSRYKLTCKFIIPPYGSMGGILRLLYVYFFLFFFVCSVKLFSAVAGPIGAKFDTRHEPDARQVLRNFGGATPRDREIIAQNVKIRGRVWGQSIR